MRTAEITKTLQKLNAQPKEHSLGFNRWTVLPLRVRRNVILDCALRNQTLVSMSDYLNTLTEDQYITWLQLA